MFQGVAVVAAAAILGLSSTVVAQSQASCSDSTWNWSYNSLKQDPCHVAQALGKQCDPTGLFIVPTLPLSYYYSGNIPEYATDCVCNTVYYSVLSVCGQCQDSYAAPWPLWNFNCTKKYVGVYPENLPESFPVPDWAFQPLLSNGTVNFQAAAQDGNPDSTAPPSPTYTNPNNGGSGGGSSGNSTNGDNGNSGNNGNGGKSTPIGAVVGGAVGGTAFLAIVVLLVWLILRQRKGKPQYRDTVSATSTGNLKLNTTRPPSMISEKPYNPSDPSTYPSSLSSPVTPGAARNSFIATPFVPGTGPDSHPGRPESQYNIYNLYGMQPQQTGHSGYTTISTTPPPQPADQGMYPSSLSPPVTSGPAPNSFVATPFVPGTGPDYQPGRPETQYSMNYQNPYGLQPQQMEHSGHTGTATTMPPPQGIPPALPQVYD